MNERIKELAEQAGVTMQNIYPCYERDIERFAELVRQDEREACAKICDDEVKAKLGLIGLPVVQSEIIQRDRAKQWSLAAEAIRARGNT